MILLNQQVIVNDRSVMCIGYDFKTPKIFKIVSIKDGEVTIVRHFTVSWGSIFYVLFQL